MKKTKKWVVRAYLPKAEAAWVIRPTEGKVRSHELCSSSQLFCNVLSKPLN
ncbi:1,4-alpha-glucan (glycogen) branching enzyme, GH-13-type [Crocosphaera watsonii WH 0005]|uniref:1,4-alpha-glucan (Glycogen) branching enzyme, GH-13-type n=1 Tax=Crocosphaera watsonii WH 0005 TaxID=423472 RepID=T2IPB4_CROWT|nr:hypothetical protein [Crocosphaera watsonii]CCQ54774.1 1,4-alpha-glucan (glycogen) branching enzyme, GH-13-type [Crocosphaera watsonii WH 0005]